MLGNGKLSYRRNLILIKLNQMIANNFESISNKTWIRIGEFQEFLDSKTKRGQSAEENFRKKAHNSSNQNKFVSKNFRMRPKSGNITATAHLSNFKFPQKSSNPDSQNKNPSHLLSAKTCKNIEKTDSFLNLASTTNPTYQSMKEIQNFIKNSALFNTFKNDLQDLFDLARSPDCDFKHVQDTNLYFALREEIESELSIKFDSVENDLEKIILRSLNYSKEFVKDIKVKGDKDLAIIAEYLTRFHLKVIDRTYQALKKTAEMMEKNNIDTLENWKGVRKDDANKAKEIFELKFTQIQEELRKTLNKNEELKGVISKLRLELLEKNKEIINLTEVDTGVSAMQSLDHLLKSLNMVILDTKDQRKQKSRMIKDFQQFFASVEQVNRPSACVSAECQTDWSIPKPKIPVALLRKPIISTNILYNLDPGDSEQTLNNLKPKIIESLLSFSLKKSFLHTLSENIFEFFQNKPEKISALFQAVQQITLGSENWSILSRYLLGINKDLPNIVEKALCNILGVFSSHLNLEKSEISLPVEEFFHIIEKNFKNFPKFQHWVLTKAIVYTEQNFAGKVQDSFSVFCMRFAVNFEKTKENLKQSLEKFSKVKTGLGI